MKKLKILIGGGLREIVEIKSNGGGGIFTYFLAHELAKRGHEVTILGLKESNVPGCKVIPIADTEEEVMRYEENYLVHDAYQLIESQYIALHEKEYDIIHISYYHYLFAPLSKFVSKPIVYTEHLPLLTSPIWQQLLNRMSKPEDIFVFIAKHEYEKANLIKNKACILHGMDTTVFSYCEEPEDYIFWIGRTKAKKGLKEAVITAVDTGVKLKAAQATKRPDDKIYFEEEIKPISDNHENVEFLGIITYPGKIELYQKAKVFIFPINWEEPFGLTMIEAMATGTPVIAFARGSVPEVVVDGETGFIVNSSDDDIRGDFIIKKTGVEGLKEAVKKIYSMPKDEYMRMRVNARKHIEKNFSVERMVDDYENIYQKIVDQHGGAINQGHS